MWIIVMKFPVHFNESGEKTPGIHIHCTSVRQRERDAGKLQIAIRRLLRELRNQHQIV